jgi:hypothetical protein
MSGMMAVGNDFVTAYQSLMWDAGKKLCCCLLRIRNGIQSQPPIPCTFLKLDSVNRSCGTDDHHGSALFRHDSLWKYVVGLSKLVESDL